MRLLDQLIKIEEEKLTSFHVPGHKYTKLYDRYYPGFSKLLSIDFTEIPGTDDLHDAESCIKESQSFASEIYQTKETFFLVGGTTSGIYAMIMASTKPGDKIIVARDCHRAVYDAILLGHLEAIYIEPVVSEIGIVLGVTPESVQETVHLNPDAKAVILTYPNYNGITCDLKSIESIVHKNDMLLLVDEAHGAHLHLSALLPASAIELGADIVVQSSHKSLPVLTQASMLHLNSDRINRKKLKDMLKLHQTSSPSYLLMSSLDIAISIMVDYPDLMGNHLNNIKTLKDKLPLFLVKDDLPKGFDLDITKLTLLGKRSNMNPMDLDAKLRKYGIQCEFSNANYAVFVTSIMNDIQDFEKLIKTMEMLKFKCYSGIEKIENVQKNIVKMSISDAYYHNKNKLLFRDAKDEISASYIIPYPPGIPLLIPGEVINENLINKVKIMLENRQKIIGFNSKEFDSLSIDVVSD